MTKKNKTLGINWSLHYRNLYEARIKRLTERYRELYDENQMMTCSFVDVATGKRTDVNISKTSDSETSNDIDKFLVE